MSITVVVSLIDKTQRDEDDRPFVVQSRTEFTVYELARMSDRDFWKHTFEENGREVMEQFRSEDYENLIPDTDPDNEVDADALVEELDDGTELHGWEGSEE